MAGWKLRKDKAQAEAPETTEDTSLDDPLMPGWDTPAAGTEETFLPAADKSTFETDALDTEFDNAPPHQLGGVIALGSSTEVTAAEAIALAPPPDFESSEEVRFDEEERFDEPVSFDENEFAENKFAENKFTEDEDKQPAALIFYQPEPEARDAPEARDVPEVAPFVMDTPAAAPAPDLPHRLVMRIGKLSAAFEIVKAVTVIGRPDSELHFYPDMEVEMDDAVSRRHAEVLKSADGKYSLVDSGSTNGTRLNGETLPPHAEHPLAPGDRIHIGERTEIVFE